MSDFAEELAAATPTPGGGAAAARTGLYAASLVRMVTSITLERSGKDEAGLAARRSEVESVAGSAEQLAAVFRRLESEDVQAFEAYMTALRLPRKTPQEKERRDDARRQAAERATDVPLRTLDAALEVFDLVRRLLDLGGDVRLRAESDLGGAVELARAAFVAAEWNVRVNLPALKSSSRLEGYRSRWALLRKRLDDEYEALRGRVGERL